MRLKNIHLNNALRKLEATMRSKEQLAGALVAWCRCCSRCCAALGLQTCVHAAHAGLLLTACTTTPRCLLLLLP